MAVLANTVIDQAIRYLLNMGITCNSSVKEKFNRPLD